jgi:hypothetical protein
MFRSSRPTVWVTGTVAALAVLFGAVPAALADSSVLTTGHPDLTAAQAISPKQVLACFDKIVATPFNFTDSNFYLQGYTESRKTGAATGLTISTETPVGGGFCVVVVYTGAGDVRTYSRVVVLAGAVTASVPGGGGSPNVQGSAPLVGAGLPNGPGGTLRPQLAQAAPNGATTVLYTFDEALTAAAGTTAFGFYDSTDTAFHAGTVTGFTPGTGVTVTFGAADAALFSTATRYVVGEGAVTDGAGQTNPVGVVGSATQRLDLAATTGKLAAAGGLTYHFDFSGPIPGSAVACPAAFALYDVSGVRYNPAVASPVTISADRRSVTLTFAAATVGGDTNQITLATVAADAIDAGACGAATPAPLNSEGAAALTSPAGSPGSTSGPDLVSFTINKSTGFASFVFDAPVASPTGVSGFHLVNGSGGLTSPPSQASACLLGMTAESFDVNPSNTVNVNFSSPTCLVLTLLPGPVDVTAARDAVGVTVDEGAVTDATTSELSPISSLGVTSAGTPPGPTGPTTPPAPTVPKVTTPTTTTKPVVLSAACKRVVTIHLLTSVSHNLRSATATVNGKKVKIGKSLTVTIPFANYKGSRTIVAKITGKLKSGRTVKTTRRYKSKC